MAVPGSEIASLRTTLAATALREGDIDKNPFRQFRIWLEQALSADVLQPFAAALATATADGRPSVRMVFLRGWEEPGFTFYTNYCSRKADELTANPWAALVVHWAELARQIRIEGKAERTSPEDSDAYFAGRHYGSKLGAWASPQSAMIPDRAFLERRMQEATAAYNGSEVPRPPHWGGFRVIAASIEFWQGGENRLHDRLRYRPDEQGGWLVQRLAP